MSNTTPASFKGGPVTTNTLASNKFILLYLLMFWLSLLPSFFLIVHFLYKFEVNYYWILFMFPLQLLVWYVVFVLSSMFWGWVFLKIVNRIYPPHEGIFPRDPNNRDFKYWSLRATIKKFPLWVAHTFPFPWMDVLAFKMFGNLVPLTTPLFDSWIDSEFLEIGEGTTIGQGSVIMTSMITTEFLIIKRVRIGKHCVIGAHSVVAPGTIIHDNVILGALSSTSVGQELEANYVYTGIPARKFKKNEFREKDNLTSEERAKIKEYEELIKEIPDELEDTGKKVIKLIHKSEKKVKRAEKQEGKAIYHLTKAEQKYRKYERKAEKYEKKADKKIKESRKALEKAKSLLEKKKKIAIEYPTLLKETMEDSQESVPLTGDSQESRELSLKREQIDNDSIGDDEKNKPVYSKDNKQKEEKEEKEVEEVKEVKESPLINQERKETSASPKDENNES